MEENDIKEFILNKLNFSQGDKVTIKFDADFFADKIHQYPLFKEMFYKYTKKMLNFLEKK